MSEKIKTLGDLINEDPWYRSFRDGAVAGRQIGKAAQQPLALAMRVVVSLLAVLPMPIYMMTRERLGIRFLSYWRFALWVFAYILVVEFYYVRKHFTRWDVAVCIFAIPSVFALLFCRRGETKRARRGGDLIYSYSEGIPNPLFRKLFRNSAIVEIFVEPAILLLAAWLMPPTLRAHAVYFLACAAIMALRGVFDLYVLTQAALDAEDKQVQAMAMAQGIEPEDDAVGKKVGRVRGASPRSAPRRATAAEATARYTGEKAAPDAPPHDEAIDPPLFIDVRRDRPALPASQDDDPNP